MAFDKPESSEVKTEAIDRAHLMKDVLQPTDNMARNVHDGFNAFADHYQNYLLERVSRALTSDAAGSLIDTIVHGAKNGEPLHAMLLADLQKRQLIPQQA